LVGFSGCPRPVGLNHKDVTIYTQLSLPHLQHMATSQSQVSIQNTTNLTANKQLACKVLK